jgi:hypothetical protein
MTADEPVPPRVLAAEARREFRERLNRTSLGCPTGDCEHPIGQHDADDYDRRGDPINPVCSVPGCPCPEEET